MSSLLLTQTLIMLELYGPAINGGSSGWQGSRCRGCYAQRRTGMWHHNNPQKRWIQASWVALQDSTFSSFLTTTSWGKLVRNHKGPGVTYYPATFIVSSLPAMLSKVTQNERVFLTTYTVIQWNNERTFLCSMQIGTRGGDWQHMTQQTGEQDKEPVQSQVWRHGQKSNLWDWGHSSWEQ